jgi:sensor c-di-GMP phosphodiesterase-like protein
LKYPFDTLKIDKEFVTAIEPDTRSTKIVEGIISLAILVSKFLPKGWKPSPNWTG